MTAERVLRRGDDAAVLRMSETEAAEIGNDPTTPDDDERVLLNMGPLPSVDPWRVAADAGARG